MVVRHVGDDDGRVLLEMLDALRQGAQGTTANTVRVLVAADEDGVCAAKILVNVLLRIGVKFVVVPITGNSEIQTHFEKLEEDSEVRSVVLVNCGGGIALQALLEDAGAPAGVRCYVVDAHRPLELTNLSKRSTRVLVLDDDDDEDASNEKRADLAEFAAKKHAISRGEDAEESFDTEEDQARWQGQQRKLQEYYLTTYHATPAALSLFKMAKQSAAPSQDLLWLASVSLVSYHEQGLITDDVYQRLLWEELKEALDRTTDSLNLGFTSQSSGDMTSMTGTSSAGGFARPSGGAAFDKDGQPAAKRRRPPATGATGTASRNRLRFETDLKLTLYKHWTIEESMMHSSYFYGAMELHRDKGVRSLKNFFATAGIPRCDTRQMYNEMSWPSRKTLHSKFRVHGKAYGLGETQMFMAQFVRDLGTPLGELSPSLRLHELSCVDASHIVTALLSKTHMSLHADSDSLPKREDGTKDTEAIKALEKEALVANFWEAYEAVNCMEPALLLHGIERAVDLAKAIQNMVRQVKDMKLMRESTSKQFRYCKIRKPPAMFRHPLSVRRLAVWLLQVLYTYRPNGEPEKPTLVIIHDEVHDSYLMVGTTPNHLSGQDLFGFMFRRAYRVAAGTLNVGMDFFDNSCCEVAEDDFDRFWRLVDHQE